jgi:hypothetical protein
MSCPVLINPTCLVGNVIGAAAGAAAGTVANDALSAIASAIQSGVSWIVTNSITWWVKVPSPDLAGQPAVSRLQQWMLPLAAAVAVLGLIIAGAKMALTRKANPLIDVGSGLVIIAATSAVGVLLPSLLLQAGDAWSDWVLNAAAGGQFASRLNTLLSLTGAAPAVVIVLGLIAILISAAQAILMLFRQASLVILAGVLPLAAAGTLTPATRTWFKKITGWELALIFYKPAAAAVYAAAFNMAGTGTGARSTLMGFAMIALSLLALPVLMRLFTWTTGTISESAAGSGFLQTALSGTVALGALRGSFGGSSGSGAAGQARLISDRLGSAGSGPSGAQAPGTGVRQAAAPAPATSFPPGTSGSAAAASGAAAASTGARTGAAPGAAAGAAPAAAGGPAGLAVAGLAAGAATARRKATEAMQPPAAGGGQ